MTEPATPEPGDHDNAEDPIGGTEGITPYDEFDFDQDILFGDVIETVTVKPEKKHGE